MDPLTTKRGAKPHDIKINNRQIILELLREKEQMSLNEMAFACSLSRNTVKKCVDHFLERGLVAIMGKGVSTSEGGKRPDIYGINRSWGVIASVYYQGNELVCALYDPCLQLIEKMTTECPNDSLLSPEDLVERTFSTLERALTLKGKSWSDLRGVNFGDRRLINVEEGAVVSSLNEKWSKNFPLREMLKSRLGGNIEVSIGNAVHLLAISEHRNNTALRENSVLICAENPFASAAVIQNGRVVAGNHHVIGVLSAIPIVQGEDEPLTVGKDKKSLRNMVSVESLSRYIVTHHSGDISLLVSAAKKGTLTLKAIFEGARKKDPVALSALNFAIKWFTIAIHYFVYTLDPNLIMISGEYLEAPEYFFRELKESVKRFGMQTVQFSPEIIPGSMGVEEGAVYGGACMMLEHLFRQEELYQ